MVANSTRIRNRKTGEVFDCFIQCVDLNFDGRWVLRWNIGINGYNDWSFICAEYNADEFNRKWEVIDKDPKW